MDIKEWEYCKCECHNHRGVVHIMPCCYVCPYCKKRIDVVYYDAHIKRHNEEETKMV